MHVAIACTVPFPDATVFAREQARSLIDDGHEVTILAPISELDSWPGARNVPVVETNWQEDEQGFNRALDAVDPDVVHLQSSTGLVRLPVCRRPTVMEILSASLRPTPLRQAVHLMSAWRLRHIPTGCANPQLVGGPLRPADFKADNGYSSWAPELARARRDLEVEPGLFVHQGSTSPLRRLDLLLEALNLVRRTRRDVKLHFIGDPETKQMRTTIERLRLQDCVTVTPTRHLPALTEVLARATGTVAWVPRQRGFDQQPPLKVLDSLAAGIPQLATTTTAIRGLLTQGGGLVAEADPRAFAATWVDLIERIERGDDLSMEDRDGFLTRRSWQTIVTTTWVPHYAQAIDSFLGPAARGSRQRQPRSPL